MACYHPLIGIDKGYDEDGKHIVKILPNGARSSEAYSGEYRRVFDIPCGHCIGCRQSQSNDWANRLLMESLYHKYTHFLTLTYCDEYIRYNPGCDLLTGEFKMQPTLHKPDCQAFMKRIRKKFGAGIKFYLVGEYGETTSRPHYHAVLFGLPEERMHFIPCGRSETGNPYFRSPEIEVCWKATEESDFSLGCNAQAAKQGLDPSLIGFCSIEPANYFTMKYVAAYVTKKIGARPDQEYLLEGRVPPFSLSSRRPAIGLQYLIDHPECVEQDKIIIPTPKGKAEFSPPRYFRKKVAEYDPGLIDELSERHLKAAADKRAAELSRTDLLENDYLKVKELNHIAKIKNRNKI